MEVPRWAPRDPIDPRSPLARPTTIALAASLALAADEALSTLQGLLASLDGGERAEALAVIARQAPAALRVVMPHYGRFGLAP